jgi:hypothetical protein
MIKGLSSLLFKDPELPTGTTPPPTSAAPANATPVITTPASTAPATGAAVTGAVRAEMLAAVRQEVFEKNPTAYVKLLDMANKMKAAIPDETMRLKAAIPVVGVTATDINAAMTQHTQALHGVQTRFGAESSRQRDSKVVAKEARRAVIASDIAALAQQMSALQAEDVKLAGDITAYKMQLAQTEADFAATVTQIESELATAHSRLQTLFT